MITDIEDDLLQQKMMSLLNRLNSFAPNIEASALISTDGLIMASALGDGVEADRFAAVCASLLALSEHAANEAGRGALRHAYIEGENGSVLLVHTGTEAVLAVIARPGINLGLVMLEGRRVAEKITEMLG